jgi:hypothetical protein
MAGAVLPPYGAPEGPEFEPDELIGAFASGERRGFSRDLHVEDDVLLADRSLPVAVRLAPGVVLLRRDAPDAARQAVERVLGAVGARRIESDSAFGAIAALQVTGLRAATWDLWGEDERSALEAVRKAAAGDDPIAAVAGDLAPGMTLEDLIDPQPPQRGR